jgi:hypothetical protein
VRVRDWLGGLILAGVSACDYLPYPDRRDSPVGTAQGFIAAVRRRDCDQAWTYFSPATQQRIQEQSKRMVRGAPYYSDVFAPHRIHCTPYESYRPSTVRLASQLQERATVKVMERVPDPKSFSLPGWTPIGRMDAERTMELTRDSSGWKVLPDVPEDPRAKYGEKTYDIGPAVVVTKPGKRVESGHTLFRVEGTMTMDADPADMERALADPLQWPRFWPRVTATRWLGQEDSHGYRPLSVVFSLPDGQREARIFFHQAGHVAQNRVLSFGFASEHLYSDEFNKIFKTGGKGRLRWAGTFFAGPDNGPQGGSRIRWSQSISDPLLADPVLVGSQLQAFEREAKQRKAKPAN